MGSISSIRIDLGDLGVSQTSSRQHAATAVHAPVDLADVATVPSVSQVEPLRTVNPAKFEAILSNAVRQLRAASLATPDATQAAYYSTLADRLQQLRDGVANPQS